MTRVVKRKNTEHAQKIKRENKQKLFRGLESQRFKLIEYLLSKCLLIQGSYSELLVKCGKISCYCQERPAHLVSRLGTRKNKSANTQVVRVADRENVKLLVEVYKKHRAALRLLKTIHRQQEKILQTIIDTKDRPYE